MKKKRILIVDDDPDVQKLVKKRLQFHGFQCTCVAFAETALESLKKSKPNLIILDLGLKHADGTAFLKHAKDWIPEGEKIPPILILSGHKEQEVVDYCLENGASGFITKPIDTRALLSMVHDYVR
ncbi:MAG: response regulator [Deltaproteobacteria bacterium]|nr:response regulator [Deltaproteobacteria bacterium]